MNTISVKWVMCDTFACGPIRGDAIGAILNARRNGVRMDCKTLLTRSDIPDADVIVFQRPITAEAVTAIELARQRGIATVTEFDDDLFALWEHPDKRVSSLLPAECRASTLAAIKACDRVTASTRALAEAIQTQAPEKDVWVIENGISMDEWMEGWVLRKHRLLRGPDKDAVTIGWFASPAHVTDIPVFRAALEMVLEDSEHVRFEGICTFGAREFGEKLNGFGDRFVVREPVPMQDLPRAMSRWDIGICPLEDTRFNRGKSGLKALQFWALGLPVVASEVAPYECVEHQWNGLKCGRMEDWYAALTELVDRPQEGLLMGARGRADAATYFNVERRADEWARLFKDVRAGR